MKLVLLGAAASLFAASLPLGRAVPVKRDDTSTDSQFHCILQCSSLFILTDSLFVVLLDFFFPNDLGDLTVLNFALTLENLEVAFYHTALATFSEADFEAAGYEDWVRGRFVEIMENEQTHQRVLTEALGGIAAKPCVYTLYVLLTLTFIV